MVQPTVDLVIVFDKSPSPIALTKEHAREDAQNAEQAYKQLLDKLANAGLKATGRKGEKDGQILILVSCPWNTILHLVKRERHTDFLHGLSAAALPTLARDFTTAPLSDADRLRLVHSYITSSKVDGGLAIIPGSPKYVTSITTLHDPAFNHSWLNAWTSRQISFRISIAELDKLKDHFGESVALYFAFLSSYSTALLIPTLVGFAFWYRRSVYSSAYSVFIVLWSVVFVEWWKIRERQLSIRWGTRGSTKVERQRVEFQEKQQAWWERELKVIASLPVILFFGALLGALLTALFIFEAFVTQLYNGPGKGYVGFAPTVLFLSLVPRLLGLYQIFAVKLTNWENHRHHSTHEASLTMKTFALSAVVAYLGLALSAFVYIPFGEYIMAYVETTLFSSQSFDAAEKRSVPKIDASRLQNQMYAYTVTNQIIGAFLEVGLPFITRTISNIRSGKGVTSKKTVKFEDNPPPVDANPEEKELLDRVRKEVALPEYSLFVDYSEMVTQFGYVALYSTIWPLAPAMALLNNWLELRSDALKITHHVRRPLPTRTDSIGPWLESLGSITWLAALSNSALVYLFSPTQDAESTNAFSTTLHNKPGPSTTLHTLVVPALLIALSASHGFLLIRSFVRRILELAIWKGSKEQKQLEGAETEVKSAYIQSLGDAEIPSGDDTNGEHDGWFWKREDEGLAELQKSVKTA